MTLDKYPVGRRAIISTFAESPEEAIETGLGFEPQSPPSQATLQPTDVVIAVRSAAVGWVDLLMTSGQYQHMPQPPYCPGLEYSGEAIWTGSAVDPTHVDVGDRVMVDGFLAGPRSYGAYQKSGGFATYAVIPQAAAMKVPAGFSYDQASNFLGNYETAYHCLIHCGKLQAGETVLIHGASGATGLAAVHVAKRVGATVIATGRSRDKLAIVKAQGADHVIHTQGANAQSVPRFRDEVKALTHGEGVDVVYDGVGGAISLESMRCVRFGARFLIVGWASTPDVAKGRGQRGAPKANMLPTNLIMMKGLQVLGCPTIISTKQDPSIRETRLNTLLQWANAGDLSPYVSHQFPLDELRVAMRLKWTGQITGGCVVYPTNRSVTTNNR
jgi:NADPH2:quinone reductase